MLQSLASRDNTFITVSGCLPAERQHLCYCGGSLWHVHEMLSGFNMQRQHTRLLSGVATRAASSSPPARLGAPSALCPPRLPGPELPSAPELTSQNS